jgi:hypothetical protein
MAHTERQTMKPLQINQPQLLQVLVIASPLRGSKRSLTAPTQVANEAMSNKPVYLPLCLTRIAERKIVGPSTQLPIHLLDQPGHRHVRPVTVDRVPQLLAPCPQCLTRRGNVKVSVTTAFQVEIVPERVSQKVDAAPGLAKVYHLRLLPIQLQPQPGFNLDGVVKSPTAALRFILRRCSVPYVRLTPQDSQALHLNFFHSRLFC